MPDADRLQPVLRPSPGRSDAAIPVDGARVTRLAPSPTGALHLGNARTFLVNWALARRLGWRVILRVEDLDTPRVKAGVIEQTVRTLAWLGLDWDEGPHVQAADLSPYREAMRALASAGLAYRCELTRTEIQAAASAPQEGDGGEVRFPPELRPSDLGAARFDDEQTNWRFVTPSGVVAFRDRFAGEVAIDPSETVGDFILWTKRGCPSYQLAVVVDDHRQGVTEVVRGDDLLDSAARQLHLYRALGLGTEPTYTHLPLVRGADGKRLAKRHGDTRLTAYEERGIGAARVIGLVGAWCGIGDRARPEPMSAGVFLERFEFSRMPRHDVVFTAEDARWIAGDS